MQELGPVHVIHLYPELGERLVELLSGLSGEEWRAPTVCEGWSVKDLAGHLLGDDLGNLSRRRDGYRDASLLEEGEDLSRWDDLVAFLNRYNEAWVRAMRRVSPSQLIGLIDAAAVEMHAYFASLDLDAMGAPVDWAGPGPAPVWLDVAREYTERWLHQQQIRDATGRQPLTEPRLFAPVLDTFARALPHTYRDVAAPDGTSVDVVVSGDAGGVWHVVRTAGRWRLVERADGPPAAAVTMEQGVAWRLFTKGFTRDEAFAVATLEGDRALAEKALETVSIIA